MSRTEEPFFDRLFEFVSKRCIDGGRVLEVGFGLGISADKIQKHLKPRRHDIVEIDERISRDSRAYARRHRSVRAIRGSVWSFKATTKYDAIFYDAFDYVDEADDPDDDGELADAANRFRRLLSPEGLVVCPEFGDGDPMTMPGYECVVHRKFTVPPYYLHDGTMTTLGAVSCWRLDTVLSTNTAGS